MKPEHWIGITQIVVTLAGMFIASKLAVSSSIKQFRSQKWWDRQGETYNRILESLAVIKHGVATRLNHELEPRYALEPSELLESQEATASAEVAKLAAMGPYYLSEAASAALDKVVAQLGIDPGISLESEYSQRLNTLNECMTVLRTEAHKSLKAAP
jgi:hypothetical protein